VKVFSDFPREPDFLQRNHKKNTEIVEILNVGRNTVGRIKKRYLDEGIQSALEDKTRTGQPIKYT
jgi:putative transposase